MATKKKGVLTYPLEWLKHFRPFLKRKFWKKERKEVRKDIRNRLYKDGG
jgi:hypothetical protein